jgi:endonuclease/exonuclease/phosphatase family metal-dependent hydrolase
VAEETVLGVVLKLVQLNIWQGKLLRQVIEFLQSVDADIVCLQEVFSTQPHIGVLDTHDSLEQIQAKLGYPHAFYSPAFSFSVSNQKVEFGNAILSKLPLDNQRTIFTNQDYHEVHSWSDHPPNTRNGQIVDITLNNKQITVVNHHGYHETNPVGSALTVAAMQQLVQIVRNTAKPLVFSGDLNVTSKSPTMRLFDGWLRDLTAEYNVSDTLTRYGKVRGVPCDHILVSNDVDVQKFEVSEALISDHKALILEFKV